MTILNTPSEMITLNSDNVIKEATHCTIYSDSNRKYIYKVNKSHNFQNLYALAFELECMHMKKINNLNYLPKYFQYGLTIENQPYIVMEYVHGKTLEEFLSSQTISPNQNARFIFSADELLHICQQVYEALSTLAENNVLFFDLSPKNIIITDEETLDIKIIDHTFCYYTDVNNADNLRIRQIDHQIPPNLHPAIRLKHSMMYFFTRLFYCGESHYINSFIEGNCNQSPTSFFRDTFGSLLQPTFHLEAIDETYDADNPTVIDYYTRPLDDWYNRLVGILNQMLDCMN